MNKTYDVAVIGAGVFGAWTALQLARRGKSVVLLEAYGPGHSRSSSGDESRIIRMGYGKDEIYTRWSQRSLTQWKELFAASGLPLFHETGVLWLSGKDETRLNETRETLKRCGVAFENFDLAALQQRFPQIGLEGVRAGILERTSGVLMARRAVAATVTEAVRLGVTYKHALAEAPRRKGAACSVKLQGGEEIPAGQFVFACGAWLAKIFPEVAGPRLFVTRQEVFYFGLPAGDSRFAAPQLPTFLFQGDESYGMPDIESRGLKIALDAHGIAVDPDAQSRVVSEESAQKMREYVGKRFPALKGAPIAETRVCQYENTSNGDFLIDRHPEMETVWLAGGGSGHGFKHGPAFGEYVTRQILGEGAAEPRFSLATKETVQHRAVY
ncbi:MAG: FAD-dependent oxidoreductase [Acidobacteria bacterium]|nr:FAD-dependent oxidoreductase [Acidobacteriota bacterium]MBS1864648.1 FAD-dependent oxidoreductase [Acidobacteriota bacterium]